MKYSVCFLCLLIFLLMGNRQVRAQITQQFEGLARTQVQYLLDKSNDLRADSETETVVLDRNEGEALTDQLARLRQDLVNLPAFSQARWQLDTVGEETVVRWQLEESRTVFPLVNFGGIRGNSYYQLGFNDIHFRGRGQQLTAFYQSNDGEHNYYLGLRNAALHGSRWGYALESRRYAAVEPLYFPTATVNYRYSNLSFGIDGSYTFKPGQVITLGVSTFNERYRKLADPELNTPGPERVNQQKLLFKFSHTLDRRDQFGERTAGSHHQTIAQAVSTFGETGGFLIAWHDVRLYRLLGQRGNLAARLRTGISSNDNSPFAPFVLDSQFNIRGSGNRIDRGTAQVVLNLEYRHSVWRDKKERFAAQIVGFSDFGTWRSPGGEINDLLDSESLRHFVGGGIRLISLKAHNAVIRLDYGVDVRNTRERGLVAGFGQYF